MIGSWRTNRRKLRTLQRNVSLVLVLLCCFDIAIADVFFPGSCEGESEMLTVVAVDSAANDLPQIIFIRADSQSENCPTPTESVPGEEDCFCCCTHIVPVAFYKFARPLLQTAPIASSPLNIPTAPQTKLFHPPRLT